MEKPNAEPGGFRILFSLKHRLYQPEANTPVLHYSNTPGNSLRQSGKAIIKAKFLCVLAIFVFQFALSVSFLLAQDVTWITLEGTAPMGDGSKKEARNRAIEDAICKAIEKVIGANISAETLIVNLRLSGGVLGAIPYGKVVDKEIIEESLVNIHEKGHEKPSVVYRVKMKAAVAEETTGADPLFSIEASLNRTSFKDGDEMLIKIKPTKDCYVSVFTILEDEKILRLVPNRLKADNFLAANKTFSFPDEYDKRKGIRLRAHTPEGKDAVTESLYVLALKQPPDFDTDRFQEGIYGVYNGQTAFMNDLIKEIVGIPLSERAERLIQYRISSKGL